MINIQNSTGENLSLAGLHLLAATCFSIIEPGINLSASLSLVDDEQIRAINASWRGLDQATDVLSFPSLDVRPDAIFSARHPDLMDVFSAEDARYDIGDVMISIPRAREQAKEYGHSFHRELSYLLVHGLLHLLGYDHQTPKDQSAMREKEEEILMETEKVLSRQQEELLERAKAAREFAYAPYSKYRVGAALLCEDGSIFSGCNIENVSYGLTNCAERSALFAAVSQGKQKFSAIAIAADATAPWPCGACRQVLSEFAPKIPVYITWGNGSHATSSLDELLPHSFLDFQEDQR